MSARSLPIAREMGHTVLRFNASSAVRYSHPTLGAGVCGVEIAQPLRCEFTEVERWSSLRQIWKILARGLSGDQTASAGDEIGFVVGDLLFAQVEFFCSILVIDP